MGKTFMASGKFIIMGVIACMMMTASCKDKKMISNPPETAGQQAKKEVASDSIIYPTLIDNNVVSEEPCDGSFDAENISGTTPVGLKRIMECIAKGDAKTLASLTSYPIRLRYPLKNIANKKHMIALFNTLFDKPISFDEPRLRIGAKLGGVVSVLVMVNYGCPAIHCTLLIMSRPNLRRNVKILSRKR